MKTNGLLRNVFDEESVLSASADAQDRSQCAEASRDEARTIAATPEYKRSRRERKKVEMLFAHLKRILKLDRLRLRGLTGAQDEFLLAAPAQNLWRMAKRLMPVSEEAEVAPA
jgi:Transposase DDE domain